jgi:hypothetical protein
VIEPRTIVYLALGAAAALLLYQAAQARQAGYNTWPGEYGATLSSALFGPRWQTSPNF